MFLGILIGDALGMPAEILTPEEIKQQYGRLTTYQKPQQRGWAPDEANKQPGSFTDDTQLTLAVANGIIDARGLDIDAQVKRHIEAYDDSAWGWGGTTKAAMKQLKNGVSWKEAAPDGPGLGGGNAIPMKISPVAAYMAAYIMHPPGTADCAFPADVGGFIEDFTMMTHRTPMALAAGLGHYRGLLHCLISGADSIDAKFRDSVCGNPLDCLEFYEAMRQAFDYKGADAIEKIGGKGKVRFDCLHSIPLAYHCFVRNPGSIESLYDVVNAGGDTDTNGSIVGGLLGAQFGRDIFPKHLVETLHKPSLEKVVEVTDCFIKLFIQ